MKQDHADITVVLDRSGSMASVASDTIGGFNTFLEEQKKAKGTATFTLNQFDDKFEQPIPPTDIQKVQPLTSNTFVPRGVTALLDAVGKSIVETGERLGKMPEEERPSKVVFVIMTDGHENASREYSYAKVKEMIDHQQKQYSWEFVFLGANIDAAQVGGQIGISSVSTMTYAANAVGTRSAFASVSKNLASFRSGSKSSMSYEPEDYEDQLSAGAKQ